MRVSIKKILKTANKLKVNLKVVPIETLQNGVQVELEHGRINKRTNVTDNDIEKTMKIALAHIHEYPDYYKRLLRMEKAAEKYWKGKRKKSIFL